MGGLKRFKHLGQRILEVNFDGCGFEASKALVHDFAQVLRARPSHKKFRVLVVLGRSRYDARMSQHWRAQLELLSLRVERSAVLGSGAMLLPALHGLRDTAAFLELPLGPMQTVPFKERSQALDWLAKPDPPNLSPSLLQAQHPEAASPRPRAASSSSPHPARTKRRP